MASANQKILAVDSSKFDKISFIKIADLTGVDCVVTNREPSRTWLRLFEQLHVRCLYPNPEP